MSLQRNRVDKVNMIDLGLAVKTLFVYEGCLYPTNINKGNSSQTIYFVNEYKMLLCGVFGVYLDTKPETR